MARNREFDIVVFGATGVTGRYVIEELSLSAPKENIKWAIAGRNEKKLIESLKEVATWLNVNEETFVKSVPLIVADVHDEDSLRSMAKRCCLVVNTVGPYMLYGEQVVSACVEQSTDHLDISGESQYMGKMQIKFHEQAKQKGIYIISACGFDSIPCETLVTFAKNSFQGRLNSIETYITRTSPKGGHNNSGTWNSAIESIGDSRGMLEIEEASNEALFAKPPLEAAFEVRSKGAVSTTSLLPGYAVPFLGCDRKVVIKSERFRREESDDYKPVQIQTYFQLSNIWKLLGAALVGTVFVTMAQFKFGRKLLSRYPAFFSAGLFKNGSPSREQLVDRTMRTTARCLGWAHGEDQNRKPRQEFVCCVDGPEPAYIGTSRMITQSAFCVLRERERLPLPGGCLTPGYAFEKTTLQDRLETRDFRFSVLSE